MVQVTARLPEALGAELDAAAQQLNRCRADIIRQAIEDYLDDVEDLRCDVAALKDPADPVLDWSELRDALLAANSALCRKSAGRTQLQAGCLVAQSRFLLADTARNRLQLSEALGHRVQVATHSGSGGDVPLLAAGPIRETTEAP